MNGTRERARGGHGAGRGRHPGGRPAAGATGAASGAVTAASTAQTRDHLVFYTPGGHARALRAVAAAGGEVRSTEPKLGYIVARAAGGPGTRFVEELAGDPAVAGVSSDRRIGAATALPARDAATGLPSGVPGPGGRRSPGANPAPSRSPDAGGT
ncbi:hypothetical protein [Planomonospora algeriensis]